MAEEFNLSDEVKILRKLQGWSPECFFVEDVKEFIRREFQLLLDLRDGKISSWYKFFTERDKLAGDKLCSTESEGGRASE